MASSLSRAAVAAAVLAFGASLLAVVPALWAAGLVAVHLWLAVPGIVLAQRLYGGQSRAVRASSLPWLPILAVGLAWGYALSSVGLLGLWAAGVRSPGWLLFAPVPGLLAALLSRRLKLTLTLPIFSRRDAGALALVVLAAPIIVGRPYSQVGRLLPEGRAYRAYFTADFVSNMAIVAEVSKGSVPPANPFFRADPLHYYWLMHLVPSAAHRSAAGALSIEQALLVTALWMAVAFSAFFYFFVRHFTDEPWAAAIACLFVLFCSSFEGAHQIKWHWDRGRTLEGLTSMNIDAITRSSYQGMPVDGLQRLFLYQPQHELGYLLGFSALLLLAQARDVTRTALLFVAGVFLGLAILFSSFAAGMLTLVVASCQAWRLVIARAWRAIVPCALAAALPMAAAVLLSTLLQYVDDGELVTFGVNRIATRNVWTSLFLSFGPVAIVAAVGVGAIVWKRAANRFLPVVLLLTISTLFYFLVDVPDHLGVYVAWRAGHFIFMGLAAITAFGLQACWQASVVGRAAIAGLLLAVGVVAAPTVLFDLYNTQDVWNRGRGAAFRWTVLLSPAEIEALDWIKQFTPQDALVQVEPTVRGRDTWAYIPAFAARRMSAGLPIGMIPLAKYEAASAKIREVYMATTPSAVRALAVALCVDYLVIGPPEREGYPHLQPLLDANPQDFTPAFRNDEVAIYALPGCRPASGS